MIKSLVVSCLALLGFVEATYATQTVGYVRFVHLITAAFMWAIALYRDEKE